MGMYDAEFTVRYSEVNQKNELTPISVMQYFQEIGCLHSDYVGMGLKHNAAWVIIQWKVKILGKANWNDKILVRTWPSGIQGPYCMRDYEMYKGEELIAIGTSKWVLTDIKTHKLLRITDEIAKIFEPVDKQVFSEPMTKLNPCEEYTDLIVYNVKLSDIDTNDHVNNIKYVEIAYSMFNAETNCVEVMYKHASKLGDNLNCYNNNGLITIKNGDNLSAIVRFKE